MSNERRIYKYQGTLIGDDRVDSIDINKLNTITPYLSYNSDSSSLEIGTNLSVNGNIETNGISIWESAQNEKASLEYQYDVDNIRLINYNTNAITNIPLADDLEVSVLTSDNINNYLENNLKTVFGNKSLIKDPEHPENNNIDLYVHYLSIIADSKFYNGVMFSSISTDATGTGQGLTTLFKAPADTSQQYITVSDIDHNVVGLLIWNGSTWSIQLANDNFVSVTSVTDRVEPI